VHGSRGDRAERSPEQPDGVVLSPRAERHGFTQKVIAPTDAKPCRWPGVLRNGRADLFGQLAAHLLVGIDEKDPLPTRLVDGELFLRGKTVPLSRNNARAEPAGDLDRPIFAERIHNDDFVGEPDAAETPFDVSLFVL
jgi:hypothetical protein